MYTAGCSYLADVEEVVVASVVQGCAVTAAVVTGDAASEGAAGAGEGAVLAEKESAVLAAREEVVVAGGGVEGHVSVADGCS